MRNYYSTLVRKDSIQKGNQRRGPGQSSLFPGHWKYLALMFFIIFSANSGYSQKQLEDLDRGLVAVRTSSNEVFVSWRMFRTDPTNLGFNLYRGDTKVNAAPIISSTNYVDQTTSTEAYTVRPVINEVEQEASAPANVWSEQYLRIPLERPAAPADGDYDYSPNDASVGDLDGDGEYEIILKWDPSNAQDNSRPGHTGNVYLDAYKLDGTLLWRINLGMNIRAGAHYTQFIVYDLDGDGKAELAVKTAPNTKDGLGNYLSDGPAAYDDDTEDYRNGSGYILEGPEYLTIFNGETGAEMATTNYVPERGNVGGWGDNYGNRVDRFLAGVGYFDGERPSLLMARGYYTRSVLVAWDWRNGELSQRWKFDTNDAGNEAYAGQGNHALSIADVDGDGKDEVVYGSMAVDDDGSRLYNTGLGHGDAQHVGDLVPDRPGLESWSAHEDNEAYDGNGLWLRDAGTGEKLWGVPANYDVGRGLSADIDARYPGNEMWGSAGGVYSSTGQQISTSKPSINFAAWWDGDLLREILDGDKLDKWNQTTNSSERIFTIYQSGAEKINGTKSNPNLSADILGDWREEIILRHNNNSELMVFTTTIPTTHKLYTLMHDPQYRVSVAWQNVAYNQPPHTSFFIGANMDAPVTDADNKEDFILGEATEGNEYNGNVMSLADGLESAPEGSLNFSKGTGPDWLEVGADGALSGTPADNDAGENIFTIQVSDQDGRDVDLLILKINVTDVNSPPVWDNEIITVPGTVVDYGFSINISGRVTDSDSESALQFTKVSGPGWLAVTADGTLRGTPSVENIGENTFVVNAADENGAGSEVTVSISVEQASLVHHYKFDGNAEDSEGEDHGSATGSPIYQEGVIGNAITLDGTDDFVQLPEGIANFQQITIASWVNWNGGDIWQRIFDFGNNNSSYMFLTPGNENVARFAIKTTEVEEQIINTSVLPTGEWKHLAVTIQGSTAKLFVDGVEVGENTEMTLTPASLGITQQNYIGKSQWPDPLFKGQIDDFRIYNYPLSSAEIEELATLPLVKNSQTITFGPIEAKRVGDADFDPVATASSGLPVVYTSSNPDVASVVDGKIQIVGPGVTAIMAEQDGNDEYAAAPPVTQQLVVEEVTSIPGVATTQPGIAVYPNPSTGAFMLKLKNFKNGKILISVFDGNGKLVLQKNVEVLDSRQTANLSLAGYASGLFYIQVNGGSVSQTLKVSLQR